jgi:glycosyltransferase involved in cell wall biosynthesis
MQTPGLTGLVFGTVGRTSGWLVRKPALPVDKPMSAHREPHVSVCIPAYNAGQTLRATLDSILAQSYSEIEIVVSDNHSTDDTRKVIEAYAAKGVRYCAPPAPPTWAADLPSFIGAYLNADFVLSQGRGEFLCLFHADDLYHRAMVEKQVAALQADRHAGAVFTAYRCIGEQGQPVVAPRGMAQIPREFGGGGVFSFAEVFNGVMKYGNFLPTPSVMLRRSVREEVGDFDEQRFRTSADLDMWFRIARHCGVALIAEPLLNYRISRRQFGSQYNHLRTVPSDYLSVMDHYLDQPGVSESLDRDAVRFYALQRAADELFCARHLLLLKRPAEAEHRLRRALSPEHWISALHRPARMLSLLSGFGLYAASRVGLGALAARELDQLAARRARQ